MFSLNKPQCSHYSLIFTSVRLFLQICVHVHFPKELHISVTLMHLIHGEGL